MGTTTLRGKKVLLVIAPEHFRDEELLEPRRILSERGATVAVASTRGGTAHGMLGAEVTPDLLVSDARATDYDAVVVVGGMGSPTHLWNDAALHTLLREAHAARRVVAGICLSGAVLAKAGVLRGLRATVYSTPESLRALSAGGATYMPQGVVVDGRVVTAEGPPVARAFAEKIAIALAS